MKQWDSRMSSSLLTKMCFFNLSTHCFFLPLFAAVVCVFVSCETSTALCWDAAKLTHLLPYYFPITSSRYTPEHAAILRWIVPFNNGTLLFGSVCVFSLIHGIYYRCFVLAYLANSCSPSAFSSPVHQQPSAHLSAAQFWVASCHMTLHCLLSTSTIVLRRQHTTVWWILKTRRSFPSVELDRRNE